MAAPQPLGLSRLLLVKQNFPDRRIADIPAEVARQLNASPFASRVKPGGRVAIGVGSRGISNLALIVRSVVQYFQSQGLRPFLFPAMGSHGAATAAGQADVLAHYGITEAAMGCPVESQLDVVPCGRTPEGIETCMDRLAYESDGVMLVGRVKWHTEFAGTIESGLFKMMAIGLGKFAGAQRYHTHAYKLGLENTIRGIGRQILSTGKILGGLAILEDAWHHTAQLTPVLVEEMEQRETQLLALVKSWMGKIPVPELDILIVDEIGKNISGAGMDSKIVNRGGQSQYNPWPDTPVIERIFVRDLSPLSYNNAIGLGAADAVTDRLVNQIDWEPTRINALTASAPASIRVPMHFSTDRECLEALWPTVGRFALGEVTLGWIRNTLELSPLLLSENLRERIEANRELEIVSGPHEWEFDGAGNLVSMLGAEKNLGE
jgi:hypothetical protein